MAVRAVLIRDAQASLDKARTLKGLTWETRASKVRVSLDNKVSKDSVQVNKARIKAVLLQDNSLAEAVTWGLLQEEIRMLAAARIQIWIWIANLKEAKEDLLLPIKAETCNDCTIKVFTYENLQAPRFEDFCLYKR